MKNNDDIWLLIFIVALVIMGAMYIYFDYTTFKAVGGAIWREQ